MKYLVNPETGVTPLSNCGCMINFSQGNCGTNYDVCVSKCDMLQHCQTPTGPKYSPQSINTQR